MTGPLPVPGIVSPVGETFQLGSRTVVAPDKIFPATSVGVTTPDVSQTSVVVCANTGATTITNFIGGVDGQEIKVLGDGNTTVANNTTIKTNTGANKLLSATSYYTFLNHNGIWYEHS